MSNEFNFTWGLAQRLLNKLGYIQVTGFMLDSYTELGLTRNEFLCIIHLASFHYNSPRGESRPSATSIAKRMGYAHPNSVLLLVHSLEEKEMLLISRSSGKPSTYDASPFAQAAFKLWDDSHNGLWESSGHTPTTHCGSPPQPIVDEENKEENKEERKPDLFDLALKTQRAQQREGKWAVPTDTKSSDAFIDKPVNAFAEICAKIDPDKLPLTKRKKWAKKLQEIAIDWSTKDRIMNSEDMVTAIRRIPNSPIHWKTYNTPFMNSFAEDIGPLLLGTSSSEATKPRIIQLGR